MPFIKYGNVEHKCDTPDSRHDGTPLQIGDEWKCDFIFPDAEVVESRGAGFLSRAKCEKIWLWTDPHDQRDPGAYWKEIRSEALRPNWAKDSDYIGPYGMGGGGPYS